MSGPESSEESAGFDGFVGGLEADGVGGVAVVDADGGGRFEEDDAVVSCEFAFVGGVQVMPVGIGSVGPIGAAVDGTAIHDEHGMRMFECGALFLFDLESIDGALSVAALGDVELVPLAAELGVDLRGGFGDDDEGYEIALGVVEEGLL